MSTPQELRNRFAENATIPKEQLHQIYNVIGLIFENMNETIIGDIEAMIDKDYRVSLEGYIFCLSRIISHKVAWECISKAFSAKNEKVPQKYFKQFGQIEQSITTKGPTVS